MDLRQSRLGSLLRALLVAVFSAVLSLSPARIAASESTSRARLSYTKVLKGSVPEYLEIAVDSDGAGNYDGRKLEEPSKPRPLRLSPLTTRKLFQLAADLNYFQSIRLESGKRVANLGTKIFVYERDSERNRVEFNYTLRREAQELTDLFEKIASVQQHIEDLEHAIKYDHLSLPKELMKIQIDLDNKALADAESMVPTLEQITRNPRFLNLAKVRAQNILERLQTRIEEKATR